MVDVHGHITIVCISILYSKLKLAWHPFFQFLKPVIYKKGLFLYEIERFHKVWLQAAILRFLFFIVQIKQYSVLNITHECKGHNVIHPWWQSFEKWNICTFRNILQISTKVYTSEQQYMENKHIIRVKLI